MSVTFILIPLVAAALAFALDQKMARTLALIATVANLAVALWCCTCCEHSAVTCDYSIPWIPSAGLNFSVGMDGISTLMVLLTNLLAPLIVLSSQSRVLDNEPRYYGLLLLMVSALNGVFLAQDGMLFYIFYELALIPIYFICAIWGGENRIRVTLKFFIYTFIGSLFMLVALLYLYSKTNVNGAHSFDWQALVNVQLSGAEAWWVLLGFFIAFAVKMPVFPLHTWQPDTYVTAPTGGTMLLSGIMLKMGVYGAIRWMTPLAPEALHDLTPVFMVLAVTGIVYASIIAIKQSDLKRLIAYSSIAHVGLIAAGVLAWNKSGLQGSLIQMLNHGINVVGLFFVVDILERRYGTRLLSSMSGIAKTAPAFATMFMIILLGSVAVPLTNGFPGEFLLLNGVWNYSNMMGAIAGLTIILGAVYMLRAYGLPMFGEPTEETARFEPLDLREQVVLGAVSALVLLLGFFPNIVLNLTDGAVNRVLGAVQL